MLKRVFADTPLEVPRLDRHACRRTAGRDVDSLRRFVHTLVSQQLPADPVSPT